MQAIIQDRYGTVDVLRLADIAPPTPREDEVLVRVRAASVHPDVWHTLTGRPFAVRLMGPGLRRPRTQIPGIDVSGHVESVGSAVAALRPGDDVFGETTRRHQWVNGGAFAELVAVPTACLVRKPDRVSFEQAAAVPTSGMIALVGLGQARRRPWPRVLVNGAGGGVGMFAVQLAKAEGAEVTGVDAGEKLAAIRAAGADHVIDYAAEDFTATGERYDLIIDIPGNYSLAQCRRALTPDGTYVLIGHDRYGADGGRWLGNMPHFFGLMARSPFVRQLPRLSFSTPSKQESMTGLRNLLAQGALDPVIDSTFPLRAVPDAIRRLQTGAAIGKIVITVP